MCGCRKTSVTTNKARSCNGCSLMNKARLEAKGDGSSVTFTEDVSCIVCMNFSRPKRALGGIIVVVCWVSYACEQCGILEMSLMQTDKRVVHWHPNRPTVGIGTVHPWRKLLTDVSIQGMLLNVVAKVDFEEGLVESMKHNKTRPNRTKRAKQKTKWAKRYENQRVGEVCLTQRRFRERSLVNGQVENGFTCGSNVGA